MLNWKKICCAVDLRDPSRLAMEQAAELANRLEADLTLVHVLVPPPPDAGEDSASREAASVKARRDEQMLGRWLSDAERRVGRPVRSRVLSGDPVAEIVREAREERCDLLVVGSRGRTGIPRLVLGSVAESVARQSPCPVLLVHDHGVLDKEADAEEIDQYR